MIKRIFHPIGQGAFYSERHDNFNIVYDCGNWKNTKLADKVVRQAFLQDEIIDILFISHFDFDHVNKINTLKSHTQIKKVIMPLLHNNQKHILINIYRILQYNDLITLINSPQDFFGDETQIITVSPSENDELIISGDIDRQIIDIDNLPSSISSGSILTKAAWGYDWIYIPYNYEYKYRNSELEKLLEKAGFDVEKLKKDPDYTLEKTIAERKKIKNIYSKLIGNINQNSMLLYSGSFHDQPWVKCRYYNNCCYNHISCSMRYRYRTKRVGCLYTGDADLNIVDVRRVFQHYWKIIGTIQIPHHGDLKHFNKQVLKDKFYVCPISVGKNNTYGHPSYKVIADIISERSHPVLVTENLSSGFVECIKLYS